MVHNLKVRIFCRLNIFRIPCSRNDLVKIRKYRWKHCLNVHKLHNFCDSNFLNIMIRNIGMSKYSSWNTSFKSCVDCVRFIKDIWLHITVCSDADFYVKNACYFLYDILSNFRDL